VIAVTAAALPVLLPLLELDGAAAELPLVTGLDCDELSAELGVGAAEEEGEELLLLHAATVAASARPSAGATIRRAKRLHRMTRLH
jgi:hypothetical protein